MLEVGHDIDVAVSQALLHSLVAIRYTPSRLDFFQLDQLTLLVFEAYETTLFL